MIKSRRLRGAMNVARLGKGKRAFKISTDRPTGRPWLTWQEHALNIYLLTRLQLPSR